MNSLLKPKIDWPDLARKARYSTVGLASLRAKTVRQLEREFLRNFRQSPERWINDLRLRDARAFLENGRSIKAVASAVGYKHLESFSRAFKRFFGVPPSAICQPNLLASLGPE